MSSVDIPRAIAAVEAALAAEREAWEQHGALKADAESSLSDRLDAYNSAEQLQIRAKHVCHEHAPALLAAAKESAEKDAEIERLRAVLMDAKADISDWVSFAKRQLRELPNVEHLPCGPTNNGVEVSERLMERISDTLWPGRPPSE